MPTFRLILNGRHRALVARQDAMAALEFALIAPVISIMVLSVFDGARALVAWQQVENAAQDVAQAAEKLAVSQSSTTTALTFVQMQNAMTTIYGEMPWLALGNGKGIFPGGYAVTLSEIEYLPLCHFSNPANAACNIGPKNPQIPYVLWSTFLQQGGSSLLTTPAANYLRACGPLTPEWPSWSGSIPRLTQMLDPSHGGTVAVTLTPQVVADVQYIFRPSFGQMFSRSAVITFIASASLSTPYGDTAQVITYTPGANDTNVNNCKY
jgi:hypothetical protein